MYTCTDLDNCQYIILSPNILPTANQGYFGQSQPVIILKKHSTNLTKSQLMVFSAVTVCNYLKNTPHWWDSISRPKSSHLRNDATRPLRHGLLLILFKKISILSQWFIAELQNPFSKSSVRRLKNYSGQQIPRADSISSPRACKFVRQGS
jgi:hypothetical protein